MSDTVHDFLKQGRGLIDESNAGLCAALHYDGYISIVKVFDGDEMSWGWELTEDGKHMASLPTLPDPPTAPEPPSPDDIVCEGCGQRKPDSTFTEQGGLHLCADCVSDEGSAAYIEMLRRYAEAAEERAQEAERKLAAEREAHRALVEAAESVATFHYGVDHKRGTWTVGKDRMMALRAALKALAALEGEDDRE